MLEDVIGTFQGLGGYIAEVPERGRVAGPIAQGVDVVIDVYSSRCKILVHLKPR